MLHNRAIKLSKAKVHVYSDSVLCLGEMHEHPIAMEKWKEQIGWFLGVQTTPHRSHTRAFFSRCARSYARCDHTFGSRLDDLFVYLKSHFIIGHVFVECSFDHPFPTIFSPPTTTPTRLTGIRPNPCATSLWCGPSGHLADPTPNTGYEPKFCIDVSIEHTPINLPTSNMSFLARVRRDDHRQRGP